MSPASIKWMLKRQTTSTEQKRCKYITCYDRSTQLLIQIKTQDTRSKELSFTILRNFTESHQIAFVCDDDDRAMPLFLASYLVYDVTGELVWFPARYRVHHDVSVDVTVICVVLQWLLKSGFETRRYTRIQDS